MRCTKIKNGWGCYEKKMRLAVQPLNGLVQSLATIKAWCFKNNNKLPRNVSQPYKDALKLNLQGWWCPAEPSKSAAATKEKTTGAAEIISSSKAKGRREAERRENKKDNRKTAPSPNLKISKRMRKKIKGLAATGKTWWINPQVDVARRMGRRKTGKS